MDGKVLQSLVLMLAASLAGCSSHSTSPSRLSSSIVLSRRVKKQFGDHAIKVLRTADRVEVYRVQDTHERNVTKRNVAGYVILATGKEQGRDFARRLVAVLLNDASYEWEMAKGCEFNPGVAYRVWSGGDSVLVLDCFDCDEIGVLTDESKRDSVRYGESDPARPALIRLVREALPDDQDLKGLKP